MAHKGFFALSLGLLISLQSLQSAFADIQLTFGLYATDKPTEVVKKFKPVIDVLESDLSTRLEEPVRVRIQVASTYQQGVSDLVEGRVDFARMGPASYIAAKKQAPRIEIMAVESENGTKRFYGIICVAHNSSIEDVRDLKGKSFAFGNERSTIGRYLSQLYLLEHGIDAQSLSKFAYLGRHDKVGYAVGTGQYDAGALKESTFKRLVAKGVPLRAIARFENVTKPWLARADLQLRLKNALRRSLLELADEEALKRLSKHGFLPGSDEDYETIREALNRNREFFGRATQ